MSTHAATQDPVEPSTTPPVSVDDSRLMHHEYDGIQEYDNPLPFWWSGIFVLCIVHAAWYLYWYHGGGPGKSELQEYAADLKVWEKQRAAAPASSVAARCNELSKPKVEGCTSTSRSTPRRSSSRA